MTEGLGPATTLERIQRNLVGLKMARAPEVLDHSLRRIEHGQIGAADAIDVLLSEELTLRQNRRVKMALMTARITSVKTLASFYVAFQPSLDRDRILALAEFDFIDRREAIHCPDRPSLVHTTHLAIAL
jgi:DNA replication protein DnaC